MPSSNDMMTPEEIEALMASMNTGASAPQAPPAPESPDPAAEGPMSQDEIEAFLAKLNEPKQEEIPPVPETGEDRSASPLPDSAPPVTTPVPEPAAEAKPAKVGLGAKLTAWASKLAGSFSYSRLPFFNRRKTDGNAPAVTEAVAEGLPEKREAEALSEAMPGSFSQRHAMTIAASVMLVIVLCVGTFIGFSMYKNHGQAEASPENQLSGLGVELSPAELVKYAGRGNQKIVNLFLSAGMDVDAQRESDGFTPLMAAAAFGRLEMVQMLLEQGANVNKKNFDESTALMLAVKYNQPAVVAALLQTGAKPNGRDLYGNTVVSLALTYKNPQIIDALTRAGTKGLTEELEKMRNADKKQPGAATAGQAEKTPATEVNPDFLLADGRVGYVQIGRSVESLYRHYDRSLVTFEAENRDGIPYPVVKLFVPEKKAPAMVLSVSVSRQGQQQTIDGIRVYDERFKTEDGIGIGSTLGDMKKAGTLQGVKQIDQSLYAVSKEAHLLFELEVAMANLPVEWLRSGEVDSLPSSMKIRGILLQ